MAMVPLPVSRHRITMTWHAHSWMWIVAMTPRRPKISSMLRESKTPKKFMKKRAGAKAVKAFEKQALSDEALDYQDATPFRAISAQANYLAFDGPDGSYS